MGSGHKQRKLGRWTTKPNIDNSRLRRAYPQLHWVKDQWETDMSTKAPFWPTVLQQIYVS